MQPSDTAGDGGPRPVRPEARPAPKTRRSGRLRLRNWRVPQRLIVLILVPTVTAVVLGGVRISQSTGRADAYGRVERMAELGLGITAFVHEFAAERDASVEYITARRDPDLLRALRDQQRKADATVARLRTAAAEVDGSFGTEAVNDARLVISRLDGIEALRSLATESKVPAFTVLEKYSEAVSELVGMLDGISQNVADDRLAASSRALGALARAKDGVSRERALLMIGSRTGRLAAEELEALSAARAQEDSEIAAFRSAASLEQRQRFEDTVVGTDVDQARDLRQRALSAASATGGLLPRGLSAPASRELIRQSMTAMLDKMRGVERSVAEEIVSLSGDSKSDARTTAIIEAAAVALLLVIVLLVTSLMARSLVRPLQRLRAGALEVAGTRLPGLVDRLRDPEAAADGIEVEPIDVDSTDEIGQVARAFDEVHREAVRLAADEAVLRGNINAMFVNLSRRSQSLIERQLRLIEELEQTERDEDQLANLFRLDHLATRMRRNNENLLVLGGQEQVRRWNRPVPLIDVVRASLSEVEQYERVQLRVHGDMTVAGPVVSDLVHLLAELVENATVFSAEHTRVTVSGQMLSGGGAMLQITDNGVGMAPDQLEEANWRLANPPVIDFSAARRMGLFVVGRLAVRHGIRVELRGAQAGGLTAFVVLPDAVVSPSEHGGVGTRGFTGPIPGQVEDVPRTGEYAAIAAPATPAITSGGAYRPGEPAGDYPPGRPRLATGPSRDGYGPPPGPPSPAYENGAYDGSGFDSGPYNHAGYDGYDNSNSGFDRGAYGNGPGPRQQNSAPMPPPAQEQESGPRQSPRGLRGFRALPGRRRSQEQEQPDDTMQDGGLPVREPGAQHPMRQPPVRPDMPEPPSQAGQGQRQGGEPWRTGPLPAVPEAQPAVPDTGPQSRPTWVTGPIDVPEPAGSGYGRPGDGAPAQTPHGSARDRMPADQDLPSQAQDEHAPERATPPGMRERSPIFDAMQSEWFQRRTDQTPSEDPVKGWESPADAGFRAAEAAREPVAGKRTSAGLPKRVPGRNRVPGAVTPRRPQVPPQQPQAAAAPPAPAEEAPRGAPPALSADVVRSRFASLQSGVRRGRTEARGPSGPSGSGEDAVSGGDGSPRDRAAGGPVAGSDRESPSQDEGGNGGAR